MPGEGKVTQIELGGEIDTLSLSQLAESVDSLISDGHTKLVFNLRQLKFINSSGLIYLLKAGRQAQASGGEVVLSEPSEFLQMTIQTLGLDQIVRVFPDDRAAFAHLGGDEGDSSGRRTDPPS